MKFRIDKFSELAASTASLASRSFSTARDAASKASVAAVAAGKTAQQAIGEAIEHEDTQVAMAKAKEFASSASTEAKNLAYRVVVKVKNAEAHHKEVADKVETLSMGLGITSGITAAGAALAMPTGLSAVGVALGVTSPPLIVAAAPVLGAVATVAGVVSGGAYFYSKWKEKKAEVDCDNP